MVYKHLADNYYIENEDCHRRRLGIDRRVKYSNNAQYNEYRLHVHESRQEVRQPSLAIARKEELFYRRDQE